MAENAANSVTDWTERATALVAVAGIVSADRATALMNRLGALALADPGWEAEALITVAEAIAEAGDTARGARSLASVAHVLNAADAAVAGAAQTPRAPWVRAGSRTRSPLG